MRYDSANQLTRANPHTDSAFWSPHSLSLSVLSIRCRLFLFRPHYHCYPSPPHSFAVVNQANAMSGDLAAMSAHLLIRQLFQSVLMTEVRMCVFVRFSVHQNWQIYTLIRFGYLCICELCTISIEIRLEFWKLLFDIYQ